MKHQRTKFHIWPGICALLIASALQAQTFPSKAIHIVIANAPGVPNDLIARGISQYLGPKIGQPIVVENRPGADGAIGMEACAKGAPDGHTICIAAQGAIIINALIRPKLPYNMDRDFVPVIHVGWADSAMAVHPSVPAKTFQQLFELAKAKPNAVTFGIFSYTSTGNMYAEWFKRDRSTPFYVVPYKTAPQMQQALLAGEINAGVIGIGNLTGLINAGKLRVLAVTSEERYPGLANIPTFTELGVKLPLRTWFGMLAPINTPRDRVNWLNTEFTKLAQEPEFRDKLLLTNGVIFQKNTPEEFAVLIKDTRSKVAELMKYLEIKAE
jgi:tripartite-type tricarboxylate transporter receptor subunit TctC